MAELDDMLEEEYGVAGEYDDVEGEYDEVGAKRRRPSKRQPLGFGAPQNIGIGGNADFVATPAIRCVILRLLIRGSIDTFDLAITRFDIGVASQLLGGEVNAGLYGPDRLQSDKPSDKFNPIPANTPVTINIRNDNAAAQDVSVSAIAFTRR